MLKTVPMTKHEEAAQQQKYVKLMQLAQELNMSKEKLYGYIYRHAEQIETFHLPDSGNMLYIKAADAAMLRAIFTNPEEFAQRIHRKPKK